MNKRQHKKIATSLVSKVMVKIQNPNLSPKVTTVEKKLFKNESAFIRHLVFEAHYKYLNTVNK